MLLGAVSGAGALHAYFRLDSRKSTRLRAGALANFSFNLMRRHPSGCKSLIDWDLILVMEPATILGALFGSYLNKVCA